MSEGKKTGVGTRLDNYNKISLKYQQKNENDMEILFTCPASSGHTFPDIFW